MSNCVIGCEKRARKVTRMPSFLLANLTAVDCSDLTP